MGQMPLPAPPHKDCEGPRLGTTRPTDFLLLISFSDDDDYFFNMHLIRLTPP